MKFNPVCENDVCVGECTCNPWNECLESPDSYKKCLSCKAPLSEEDDPDLCEKCKGD
jgi:hypothetical protein